MKIFVVAVYAIICVLLIGIILLQKGKEKALSSAISGTTDTFFSKNKSGTNNSIMAKFTTILAALFLIISVILTIM